MHSALRCWLSALFFLLIAYPGRTQSWLALYDKTDSLIAIGRYADALSVAKQALNQAATSFGKAQPQYAQTLGCIGRIHVYIGNYAASDSNLSASRDIYKKLNSEADSNYIEVLGNLGAVYRITGKFRESERSLLEALRLQKQISSSQNKRYLNMLGDLGNLYVVRTDYKKAEPLLLDALALKEKVFGKQHTSYISTLNSLGAMYASLENYTASEQYLQEALRLREKTLGSAHPLIAPILDNIGYIYLQQGAYESAVSLFRKSVSIYNQKNPGSQAHLKSLNNIAACYFYLKKYDSADSLYRNVLAIMGDKLGTNLPDYAAVLNNLGNVVEKKGETQTALDLYQQALAIFTSQKGDEATLKSRVLNDMAGTYLEMKQFDKSDSLYRDALAAVSNRLGKNSLEYAGILNNAARLLDSKQQTDSSIATVATVQTIISQNLTKHFLYQTTRQKQSLLDKWSPTMRTAFDIGIKYPRRAAAANQAYSSSLFLKNLLLSQHIDLFSSSLQNDNHLQLVADTLRRVSNQLATQYTLPVSKRKNLDSLETRAEMLEKELARQSAPFRQVQQELQVRWEDIRNALKPNEAAVEFVSFPYHNGRQQTDTIRYLALVLRPGDTSPQLVPLLTDEQPLRQLLTRRKGATLYATRGSEIENEQLSQGDSLYRLIWKPIEHLLTNTKTVYVSPSGLLHQVAFAALPYPKKSGKTPQYLIDRYQLKQVSSTRQVATQATDFVYKNIHSAHLYGGIRYDTAGSATTGSWAFLPGTQHEVEQISLFIGAKATVITGDKATETSVKRVSGQSPTVLHLATHGFSFPDPSASSSDTSSGGNRFQRIANPLFRTGLLLAGANPVWQGGQIPLGKDDGILTAYEVANLNLSTTKLVVLSACETALGDIRGSEGVFGLQRAFKMAGTQYLLMSLWPVSDQATSNLMTQFYRNWKKRKTVRQAFQQTQKQMRHKFPLAVWASFVLVE